MRIGFVNDFPFGFSFGGKEIQLLTYENILLKEKNEVLRIDLWDNDYINKVDLIHMFGNSNWFYDLSNVIKSNYPKIPIVISPTMYFDDVLRRKIASSIGMKFPIPNFFTLKKGIFKNCKTIIVNSKNEADQLIYLFGKEFKEKTSILYNGIESDFGSYSEANDDEFYSLFGIDPGFVLSVGFFDERKNTINLVKAFLKATNQIKQKLLLIGNYRYKYSKNAEKLKSLLEENKNKIVHIPYLDRNSKHLKAAYNGCSVHVLPSRLETPGLSNLEAMAFKKQIVVGECKPVREYFAEAATYCRSSDINSISKAIILASNNGVNDIGCKLLNEKFTTKIIGQKLKEIYTKALAI